MSKSRSEALTGRILVVDDVEMNRDALSRRLIRDGHEVTVASHGREAIAILTADACDIDLVLLDIMMPEITGLDVLKAAREKYSALELPIIMATGKTTTEDVVEALGLGASDYVTKPLDFPIVRARVQTQLSLKFANDQLAEANRRMTFSMEAAARVQQAGLPIHTPTNGAFRFAWQFHPCDELAGDGLGIIPINDRFTAVCLWDVSGHGVSAALLSVSISHLLNVQPGKPSFLVDDDLQPVAPTTVAQRLNENFPMARSNELYFTICYGILDNEAGTFRFSCAGHASPLHVQADGTIVPHSCPGLPIGITDDVANNSDAFREVEIFLNTAERIYLYSDGLAEETNTEDEQFDKTQLGLSVTALQSVNLDTAVKSLIVRLGTWTGKERFKDDVSILAIERA